MPNSKAPYYLEPESFDFPDPNLAMSEPNGLLAFGGDLNPKRILNAYRHGIFPWFSDDSPILWWSPDPRCILHFADLKISRSLKKSLRNKNYILSYDCAFSEVITACAQPRPKQESTWITPEIQHCYKQLHQQNIAHSIEVWQDKQLVGGLYGIAIGRIFCGESMFSLQSDCSKIALVSLVDLLKSWNYFCIDCQISNPHLDSMGTSNLPRTEFLRLLEQQMKMAPSTNAWLK